MTNTEKRVGFINMLGMLVAEARKLGLRFVITSFYRTAYEQNALYIAGKSKLDGYFKKSRHQFWLAVDIAIMKEDGELTFEDAPEYTALGEYWERIGGTWGGRWPSLRDIYHFEYKEIQ